MVFIFQLGFLIFRPIVDCLSGAYVHKIKLKCKVSEVIRKYIVYYSTWGLFLYTYVPIQNTTALFNVPTM